jgi:DNA-binding response OmpR family regulator
LTVKICTTRTDNASIPCLSWLVMQNSPTVLIVDDDEHVLAFLETCIEAEGYRVITAQNGREALYKLSDPGIAIDVVLSDVLMPELDGYDLCRQLRANPETHGLPILLISSQTDLEEKLKGYAVGGDDYITKPIYPEEVVAKLKHAADTKLQQAQLNQQLDESRQVAMQAMSYSGYLGQVLQFIQSTQEIRTLEQLAEQVLLSLSAFGLVGVLQLYTNQGTKTFQAVSPLETNVIELARNQGRFFDFDQRTIVNHRDFSLLIKNMPLQDPERYGILKDVLGNFCNAIEARSNYILSNNISESRAQILAAVNQALQDIDSRFKNVQYANIAAINHLIDNLEEAMLTLGLTEGQEEQIRSIAQQCLNRTNSIFDESMDLKTKFDQIKQSLATHLQ